MDCIQHSSKTPRISFQNLSKDFFWNSSKHLFRIFSEDFFSQSFEHFFRNSCGGFSEKLPYISSKIPQRIVLVIPRFPSENPIRIPSWTLHWKIPIGLYLAFSSGIPSEIPIGIRSEWYKKIYRKYYMDWFRNSLLNFSKDSFSKTSMDFFRKSSILLLFLSGSTSPLKLGLLLFYLEFFEHFRY